MSWVYGPGHFKHTYYNKRDPKNDSKRIPGPSFLASDLLAWHSGLDISAGISGLGPDLEAQIQAFERMRQGTNGDEIYAGERIRAQGVERNASGGFGFIAPGYNL